MRRTKTQSKRTLFIGAAVIAVLIGGGVIFAVTRPEPPAAANKAQPAGETRAEGEAGHAEGEHTEGEEGHEEEEGAVELTVAQLQASGITVVGVSRGGGAETQLAGRVTPMIDARAAIATSIGGTVERVLVAPGQTVRAGQAVATLVSGDAAALRADVDAAAAAAQAARQVHDRNQNLFEQGVVARQEVEGSRAQALSAEASARAARARAQASGNPNAAGRLNVVSPISGVVTGVQVGPGGFVAQGGVVAEVTNPARIELVLNAPAGLTGVQVGAPMRVSGPAGEFDAVVTGVAEGAGFGGSTTIVRARPLGGALLPAGAAVTGSIVIGGAASGFTVPSEAVQTVEGGSVVFVRTEHGFRATPVMAGRQAGGRTEIVRGLIGSERIAAANAFLLKAELAKGEAAHGHDH